MGKKPQVCPPTGVSERAKARLNDPSSADDARTIEAAFRKALRRQKPPKAAIFPMLANHLRIIRMIVRDCEARTRATRTSSAWQRGSKAARELNAALQAWLIVGGETVITHADGLTSRIRPGGVFHGQAHEKIMALSAALDAAMPVLQKRFSPPRQTGRLNDPQYHAIIGLADMFAQGMCAGSPIKRLPSLAVDKPLVRFIATMLCDTGVRVAEEAAISIVLRRHWTGPPDWPKGRQNLALRIVLPTRE